MTVKAPGAASMIGAAGTLAALVRADPGMQKQPARAGCFTYLGAQKRKCFECHRRDVWCLIRWQDDVRIRLASGM